MIGLGWIMMYNSVVEKCIDNTNSIQKIQKSEIKNKNINLNNIIVVNKI
jgi:hypothetical protein